MVIPVQTDTTQVIASSAGSLPLETSLAVASLFVNILVAVGVLYLAYKALVFTARPRLGVRVIPEPNDRRYQVGSVAVVQFRLNNLGHWFAKPAATEVKVHVNVDAECEPKLLRFGSNLERSVGADKTKTGKGLGGRRSRYLEAHGIWLTALEDEEEIELTFKVADKPGTYFGWLAATANEGFGGVHSFEFVVVEDEAEANP